MPTKSDLRSESRELLGSHADRRAVARMNMGIKKDLEIDIVGTVGSRISFILQYIHDIDGALTTIIDKIKLNVIFTAKILQTAVYIAHRS